jgi:hypothetical protein
MDGIIKNEAVSRYVVQGGSGKTTSKRPTTRKKHAKETGRSADEKASCNAVAN